MLVVVGIVAAVVLRDIAAYERPVREKRPPRPRAERPERAERAQRTERTERPARAERPPRKQAAPAREVPAPVERVVAYESDGSMLGAIALTEHDERSAARRVVSALVLLTLTLLTAGLIGAGIYRGLSGFGK